MKRLGLLALAFVLPPDAHAQEARLPQFEVASVKPIDLRARNAMDIKVVPGGRLIINAVTLVQLIAGAYGGLQRYQVSGPPWISSEAYNIEAVPPEDDYGKKPTVLVVGSQIPEKSALRLRALLIERFHLKTHLETRDHTVYDLTVAKGGARMMPGDPAVRCEGGVMVGAGRYNSKSCTMAWFADHLARLVFQTDVFDKTGLTGIYDFNLEFTPIGPFAPAASEDGAASTPALFTAVQGLGLKLEARKAPMRMVVVDRVEKLTGN